VIGGYTTLGRLRHDRLVRCTGNHVVQPFDLSPRLMPPTQLRDHRLGPYNRAQRMAGSIVQRGSPPGSGTGVADHLVVKVGFSRSVIAVTPR
jgi:hypothetical protein